MIRVVRDGAPADAGSYNDVRDGDTVYRGRNSESDHFFKDLLLVSILYLPFAAVPLSYALLKYVGTITLAIVIPLAVIFVAIDLYCLFQYIHYRNATLTDVQEVKLRIEHIYPAGRYEDRVILDFEAAGSDPTAPEKGKFVFHGSHRAVNDHISRQHWAGYDAKRKKWVVIR